LADQFHAHTPATVTQTCTYNDCKQHPFPAGGCGWERDYSLVLYDSENNGMQDVWVQERWNPQPMAGIAVNQSGVPWITQESTPGLFNKLDYIWCDWSPPQPSGGWTGCAVSHLYWAASSDATPGSTEGILVGTFTTHWTPGDPNNTPNPAHCGQQ
jgi:hypothetical protein